MTNVMSCERRDSSVRRKGEREFVVKAIQEGFKKKETFDIIFEGWVGLGFDRRHGDGKGAETPTRGTPHPCLSGQTV